MGKPKKWIIAAALLALPAAACMAEKDAATAAAVSSSTVRRGLTIPVPASQLLSVKLGDRVDVSVTLKKSGNEMVNVTLLQNVEVSGLHRPDKMEGLGTVELLVGPNDAQYLALCTANASSVRLFLRAPGDNEIRPLSAASYRRLFGDK